MGLNFALPWRKGHGDEPQRRGHGEGLPMEGVEAAMAEMERGRAVFEAAAQKVLVSLHELQSDVLAANTKMHATQMEMVRAARKRQRRSGAHQGRQVTGGTRGA
jgi:hypothetical protein